MLMFIDMNVLNVGFQMNIIKLVKCLTVGTADAPTQKSVGNALEALDEEREDDA